ncbi:unnamed protein product [Lepidochelys kempii]
MHHPPHRAWLWEDVWASDPWRPRGTDTQLRRARGTGGITHRWLHSWDTDAMGSVHTSGGGKGEPRLQSRERSVPESSSSRGPMTSWNQNSPGACGSPWAFHGHQRRLVRKGASRMHLSEHRPVQEVVSWDFLPRPEDHRRGS